MPLCILVSDKVSGEVKQHKFQTSWSWAVSSSFGAGVRVGALVGVGVKIDNFRRNYVITKFNIIGWV